MRREDGPGAAGGDPLARDIERRKRAERRWGYESVAAFVVGSCGRWMPDPWVLVSVAAIPLFVVAMLMRSVTMSRRKRDTRRWEAVPQVATDVAPVVYLRAFDDDEVAARLKGDRTEEEHLTEVLSSIGPVVAIGRPGERHPELGAARLYADDGEWQFTVEALLRAARLVVLRTGERGGLRWEIGTAARIVSPERFLLVVDDLGEMRACLAEIRKVHARAGGNVRPGWGSIASVRGFVMFDDRWHARFLKAQPSALSMRVKGSVIGPRLMLTLRPVFKRLELPWRRPERLGLI